MKRFRLFIFTILFLPIQAYAQEAIKETDLGIRTVGLIKMNIENTNLLDIIDPAKIIKFSEK